MPSLFTYYRSDTDPPNSHSLPHKHWLIGTKCLLAKLSPGFCISNRVLNFQCSQPQASTHKQMWKAPPSHLFLRISGPVRLHWSFPCLCSFSSTDPVYLTLSPPYPIYRRKAFFVCLFLFGCKMLADFWDGSFLPIAIVFLPN